MVRMVQHCSILSQNVFDIVEKMINMLNLMLIEFYKLCMSTYVLFSIIIIIHILV